MQTICVSGLNSEPKPIVFLSETYLEKSTRKPDRKKCFLSFFFQMSILYHHFSAVAQKDTYVYCFLAKQKKNSTVPFSQQQINWQRIWPQYGFLPIFDDRYIKFYCRVEAQYINV